LSDDKGRRRGRRERETEREMDGGIEEERDRMINLPFLLT
jgi:hypothetical protein